MISPNIWEKEKPCSSHHQPAEAISKMPVRASTSTITVDPPAYNWPTVCLSAGWANIDGGGKAGNEWHGLGIDEI